MEKTKKTGHHEPADMNEKNPVSERALVARIKRVLAKERKALRRCHRRGRGFDFYGVYYLLDVFQNQVLDTHVNIEALGRKLNVLGDWEMLQAE